MLPQKEAFIRSFKISFDDDLVSIKLTKYICLLKKDVGYQSAIEAVAPYQQEGLEARVPRSRSAIGADTLQKTRLLENNCTVI